VQGAFEVGEPRLSYHVFRWHGLEARVTEFSKPPSSI
jgi:hypothetical protein